jgi:hypothetical protein
VISKLESTKRDKAAKEMEKKCIHNLENERKIERAKQVKMKLEASKQAYAVEAMDQLRVEKDLALKEVHELQLRKKEMDLMLKVKQIELDAMSEKLQDLTKKISETSISLAGYKKKVKSKKLLVRYYDKKDRKDIPTNSMELDTLINARERAFCCVKGRHASTKARLLLEAIMSGKLLQGEAANVLHDVAKQYIIKLFRPWKLVKAGDVSAVGGFKTTTINALRTVVDEKCEGLFPSPTTVNRARALLDNYGSKVIGYYREDTKYGEVYHLNFEQAFRLLLKACNLYEYAQTTSV